MPAGSEDSNDEAASCVFYMNTSSYFLISLLDCAERKDCAPFRDSTRAALPVITGGAASNLQQHPGVQIQSFRHLLRCCQDRRLPSRQVVV